MTNIKQALAAAAFTVAAIAANGQSASAAPLSAGLQAAVTTQGSEASIVKVGFKKGGRKFRRFHRRWHHAPYYGKIYYGHSYGYRRCHWLKKKAIRTGRPYWWNRFYNCRGYY